MSQELVDTTAHTGGNLDKRSVWQDWAFKHLKDLRLTREAGLLNKKEGWRNTVEHSLVVNGGAVLLARKISGGTRSAKGSQTRFTLASLFGSWGLQNKNPLEECFKLLQAESMKQRLALETVSEV